MKTNKIKLNILIIGSSDQQCLDNSYSNNLYYTINEVSDIEKTKIPCSKFKGRGKRCKTCDLIKHEHDIGYQMIVHPPHTHELSIAGTSHTLNNSYSDFWREKYFVFLKIQNIIDMFSSTRYNNISINYDTIDPLYKTNNKYNTIIDKINSNISKKLGFESINRKKHYQELLNSRLKTNNYNFVIVISAGLGIMHSPQNIKIIYNILKSGGGLLHMSDLILNNPDKYDGMNKHIHKLYFTPLNAMCMNTVSDKKNRDRCNADFFKMLKTYKFTYYPDNVLMKT